ncbi:hypothetical protein BVG16_13490 [Paenibacillus selenitireducens]|uniref:Uncharacterized protein n=1 Tax=Paenibacillus selenitireducens TaxID=1324314 RepID=A0A1T2XCX6_9BACL|nr:hypothetical protein [Paenibacillus selenitireducens]OPA77463.1 hypothetical protein BVG16_13490 [Paenibacillus selenitireducens]
MSTYLTIDDSDYVANGVQLTMPLIIRASAIIDGVCKRSIAITSYTERVPLTDNQRGHLSYYPVNDVTAVRGRPTHGITGIDIFGPPTFQDVSTDILDVDKPIGTLWCGYSLFGVPYSELEVTYTSGWEDIPEKVKVACGLIINQLASNPNPNVKAKKDFDLSIEYFSRNMVTPEISELLSEYVLRFFR